MAPDYKAYLATQIIAERQTVSYRNVSRALKVHVNAAKCMLYEFYQRESKKKSGSVYATYLVAGVKREDYKPVLTNGAGGGGGNDSFGGHGDEKPLPSSPPAFPSFNIDPSQQSFQSSDARSTVPVRTISLIREETLEEAKQKYESISSIHIYSLSPGRLPDLVTLTDIGRGIFADGLAKEDPLADNKTYGIIQNKHVRKRTGKRPVIYEATGAKFQPLKKEEKSETKSTSTKPTDTASKPKEESRPSSRDSTPSLSSSKPASLKRDGSNLFKAFAKQQQNSDKNKSKANGKLTREDTDASASGRDDTSMKDAPSTQEQDDEGESEDEALFLDTGTKKPASRSKKREISEIQKEREDKAAKLRKMMDSDDEHDENDVPKVEDATEIDADPPAAQDGVETDEDHPNKEEIAWSESDTENTSSKTRQNPTSSTTTTTKQTEPKRRRGKRKIMKKRTMKDEDGYLVTKEEAVWESFSEDEPEPQPQAKQSVTDTTTKSKNAFGSMKGSSTTGQSGSQKGKNNAGGTTKKKGDIMSFFGKK